MIPMILFSAPISFNCLNLYSRLLAPIGPVECDFHDAGNVVRTQPVDALGTLRSEREPARVGHVAAQLEQTNVLVL